MDTTNTWANIKQPQMTKYLFSKLCSFVSTISQAKHIVMCHSVNLASTYTVAWNRSHIVLIYFDHLEVSFLILCRNELNCVCTNSSIFIIFKVHKYVFMYLKIIFLPTTFSLINDTVFCLVGNQILGCSSVICVQIHNTLYLKIITIS